ncbi:F5/8 type C domain-containing protein [Abditibacterium utsteinense]|uniref:F5/8 type C domain-containing protein n=1 Tax=Abditibacterium utsteinense TaxID=1960156 RepID=A0A2S8SQR1_9BACT|nr:discoidin domain-containing protein [Abditibacterium utsteinense]PQV63144.1 F5/8 type C domain-containing protein [Abditibacterium utsteinense]
MKSSYFFLTALGAAIFPVTSHAQNRVLSTDTTNIAAAQNGGRVLSVTSTLDNDKTYSASNLIDGQAFNGQTGGGSKGWASNKFDSINMDSITLGFAGNQTRKIGKIVLNPAVDLTPERWAKDVEVQVSTDTAEGPYVAVAQLTLKRDAAPQEFPILPVDARFVRLMFRSNWGSDRAVGLGEVEIYEAIDGSDETGQLIGRLESAINDLKRYRQVQLEGGNAGTQVAAAPIARRATKNQGAQIQNIQLVTGDAAAFPTANVNIAAGKNGGKIVAFSSIYNNDAEFTPDKLLDGQNYREADGKGSAGWASQGFTPGKEFVTVGFANDRTHLIGRVTLNPASNQSDLRYARRVEVQVTSGDSKDGPWKSAAIINLSPRPVNQDFTIRPVEAKYVKFIFQANGPGVALPNGDPNVNSDRAVSLGEIEIYEAVAGNDQLESLIGRFNQVLVDFKTLRRRQINGDAGATTPTDNMAAPAALNRAPVGKVAVSTAKTAPKRAKKNIEEASLNLPSRNG